MKKMYLEKENCICYNASRQKKRSERLVYVGRRKAPVLEHWGFSIPNFGNGRA